MPPLTQHQAIRVLLNGVSGINASEVARGAGVAGQTVRRFMRGTTVDEKAVERIAWFVWRRLNATVLLCDADRVPEEKKPWQK